MVRNLCDRSVDVCAKGMYNISVFFCHKTSPHHATQAALDKECSTCHDSPGVSDYSTKAVSYRPSKVTPKSTTCKMCHREGSVKGIKVVTIEKTHHGTSLKDCTLCHDTPDRKNTNVRTCERCHSVQALHEVLPHLEKNACAVCHLGKTITTAAVAVGN